MIIDTFEWNGVIHYIDLYGFIQCGDGTQLSDEEMKQTKRYHASFYDVITCPECVKREREIEKYLQEGRVR